MNSKPKSQLLNPLSDLNPNPQIPLSNRKSIVKTWPNSAASPPGDSALTCVTLTVPLDHFDPASGRRLTW
jgi:hypothetical protein